MSQKYTGTLKTSPFSGGWMLELPDGGRATLVGRVPGPCRDGDRVQIDATLRNDLMGIDMVGPILDVRSIQKL